MASAVKTSPVFLRTVPPLPINVHFRSGTRACTRLVLCLACLLCSAVSAADSGCSQPSSGPAGQTVYVDPQTGELLSEPLPGQALDSVTRQPSYPDVVEQPRPDGSVVADVGDRFITELHAEVVDGKLVTCHRPVTAAEPAADEADS